jgi:hypothetical protein
MTQGDIEGLLRSIEALRAPKGCSAEEQLRFFIERRRLWGKIEKGRIKGDKAELLEEVNAIYESELAEDRIKEQAKRTRLALLWNAIERRR